MDPVIFIGPDEPTSGLTLGALYFVIDTRECEDFLGQSFYGVSLHGSPGFYKRYCSWAFRPLIEKEPLAEELELCLT